METLADKIPDFPTCRWGGKIDIVIFEKETANTKGSKSCLTKVRWKPGGPEKEYSIVPGNVSSEKKQL